MAPAPSPTRQQRFVTAMFGLIVVLASMQIIALVAHSPSDKNSPGIVSSNGVATPTDRVDSTDSGVRRIASGRMEDQSLRGSSGVASNGGAAPGGVVGVVPALNGNGHRGGDSSGRAKHNGLSMANPRAFEMVSADMGHLKDKVRSCTATHLRCCRVANRLLESRIIFLVRRISYGSTCSRGQLVVHVSIFSKDVLHAVLFLK